MNEHYKVHLQNECYHELDHKIKINSQKQKKNRFHSGFIEIGEGKKKNSIKFVD